MAEVSTIDSGGRSAAVRSPLDAHRSRRHQSRTTASKPSAVLVWWIAGGLLVLLGVAYVAAHFMADDSVPRNATVNGVAIGGLDIAQATATLSSGFLRPTPPRSSTLTGQPGQSTFDLAGRCRAGGRLRSDGASGRGRVQLESASADPCGDRRWPHRARGNNQRGHCDDPHRAAGGGLRREPVDAKLALEGITVGYEPMLLGTSLNVDKTVSAIAEGYQQAARRPIDDRDQPASIAADLTTTEPQITDAEAEPVLKQAELALQPVTVRTPDAQAELAAERIAEATSFTTSGWHAATRDRLPAAL